MEALDKGISINDDDFSDTWYLGREEITWPSNFGITDLSSNNFDGHLTKIIVDFKKGSEGTPRFAIIIVNCKQNLKAFSYLLMKAYNMNTFLGQHKMMLP